MLEATSLPRQIQNALIFQHSSTSKEALVNYLVFREDCFSYFWFPRTCCGQRRTKAQFCSSTMDQKIQHFCIRNDVCLESSARSFLIVVSVRIKLSFQFCCCFSYQSFIPVPLLQDGCVGLLNGLEAFLVANASLANPPVGQNEFRSTLTHLHNLSMSIKGWAKAIDFLKHLVCCISTSSTHCLTDRGLVRMFFPGQVSIGLLYLPVPRTSWNHNNPQILFAKLKPLLRWPMGRWALVCNMNLAPGIKRGDAKWIKKCIKNE